MEPTRGGDATPEVRLDGDGHFFRVRQLLMPCSAEELGPGLLLMLLNEDAHVVDHLDAVAITLFLGVAPCEQA
jgi:hypothetical protein